MSLNALHNTLTQHVVGRRGRFLQRPTGESHHAGRSLGMNDQGVDNAQSSLAMLSSALLLALAPLEAERLGDDATVRASALLGDFGEDRGRPCGPCLPPIPAANKDQISAPSSAASNSGRDSSAAFWPITGCQPAPRPPGQFLAQPAPASGNADCKQRLSIGVEEPCSPTPFEIGRPIIRLTRVTARRPPTPIHFDPRGLAGHDAVAAGRRGVGGCGHGKCREIWVSGRWVLASGAVSTKTLIHFGSGSIMSCQT